MFTFLTDSYDALRGHPLTPFVAFFALAGLPAEAAMLLSFMGTAVIMAWSLAGACVHLTRKAS